MPNSPCLAGRCTKKVTRFFVRGSVRLPGPAGKVFLSHAKVFERGCRRTGWSCWWLTQSLLPKRLESQPATFGTVSTFLWMNLTMPASLVVGHLTYAEQTSRTCQRQRTALPANQKLQATYVHSECRPATAKSRLHVGAPGQPGCA